MSTEQPAADFYVTGGTMSPDADSYVTRPADEELLRAVERSEYCYVLTTRQMGKSSLMARTARQLALTGVRSAQITLETIRESGGTPAPDQFLYSIAHRIHKELGLGEQLKDWWREREMLSATQRFHEYLTDLLLNSCHSSIVVFIDEIDSTIGLPFADDFYATIRACYNGRASNPELKRLTFVLLGVATPAQLIADPTRTPFNIGHGIELGDFTVEQAEPLTRGLLGSEAEKGTILDRVLHWTGGHPYLTQMLCRALAIRMSADGSSRASESDVDVEVQRLFLRPEAAREEANLKFVRSRLIQGTTNLRAVLRTYQRVLEGKVVEDKPSSSIHASLKLSGVVRSDSDKCLRVRNQIYARVFDPAWVHREMPRKRVRIAFGLSTAAVFVSAVLGFYSYRETQQRRADFENFFYQMKALDVTIANLERQAAASGEAQDALRATAAQRQELAQRYEALRVDATSNERLDEQDRLILRVTRLLGENDFNAPPGYLGEVRRYIRSWQSSARYSKAIERATRNGYTNRIVADLKAQGLPPQFLYLALQESDFDPFASGPATRWGIAKGMWMLLPETAARYGLRIGPLATSMRPDVSDDRHHWERATAAAALYIKDLYATDAQASGLLVMATYAWGEIRIIDLVRKMPANPRERNFWLLLDRYGERIPRQTYDYVFSIIAAAVIGENPRLFGFQFDNPLG